MYTREGYDVMPLSRYATLLYVDAMLHSCRMTGWTESQSVDYVMREMLRASCAKDEFALETFLAEIRRYATNVAESIYGKCA